MRTKPCSGQPPSRRSRPWYRLVRQLHLWIGAWGALAAILFGATGLVLNHRFALELPQGDRREDAPVRIEVPVAARASPAALAGWLAREQHMRPLMQRVRPSGGPTRVGAGEAAQPEQWSFGGGSASAGWTLDYAAGDASAEFTRTHYSLLGSLVRLHKSGGGGIAWILLGDSFGIAMVLLGLTGLTLWARGRRPRQVVFSVLAVSALATALVLGAAYA